MASKIYDNGAYRAWMDDKNILWEYCEKHPYSTDELNWRRAKVAITSIDAIDPSFESFYAKTARPGDREVWVAPKSYLKEPYELVIQRTAVKIGLGACHWVWHFYIREPLKMPGADWLYEVLSLNDQDRAHDWAAYWVITHKPDAVFHVVSVKESKE